MVAVHGDTAVQSDVLEELAEAVNYRQWLVELGLPHLLGGAVLEVGSGRGDYAAEWAARGVRITASEADPGRLAGLERRFPPGSPVPVRRLAVPVRETGDYAAVVAYNVLEHIPDDVEALRALAPLLGPQGRLVLLVPAFPVAMSRFDRLIGHHRRYTARSLGDALAAAGYRTEVLHYVNAAGLLAWVVLVRLLGRRPTAGPGLRLWDRGLVPLLRRLERGRRPPFGQSVFAVARPAPPS